MVRLPLACLLSLLCAGCDGAATNSATLRNQQTSPAAAGDAVTLAEETMDNAMNAMNDTPAVPTNTLTR